MDKQISRKHGFPAVLPASAPEALYIHVWIEAGVLLILQILARAFVLARAALNEKPVTFDQRMRFFPHQD
jgi:hypothetical protein